LNHIELFAGCGGLSLGLEKAGFNLTLANELSPMAAETFAYNFLAKNLAELATEGKPQSKALWLSSQYKDTDLSHRLRENPYHFPLLGAAETDMPISPEKLLGKLVVGSIVQLNHFFEVNTDHQVALRDGFGLGGVDLVSGGPPCQSFSMAGLRERDSEKNILPWEFAKFVKMANPKFSVLENVTGILRPFIKDGVSYHAWFEVAKAFSEIGYVPLCLHINARLSGVPQNRPRFIMINVRLDIYKSLECSFNQSEKKLFQSGFDFFQKLKKDSLFVEFGDLSYFDVKRDSDLYLLEDSFLKVLVNSSEVTVKEALDDLRSNENVRKSDFVNRLNSMLGSEPKYNQVHNHERRKNSFLVKRRFRIYQVLQKCNPKITNEVFSILKGESCELSSASWELLSEFKYLVEDGSYKKFKKNEKNDFLLFLRSHPTKKRTQKALNPYAPAPAALSIPDDICHYDDLELRTLTVREMARIQSFPDDFIFRSKVTTGGKNRKFEVPQYTQVGNAVPPLLGLSIGKAISDLLRRL
jgi:DNA (cytosine-5)-methyltransferase 1